MKSHDLNEVAAGAVLLIGAIICLLGVAQSCLSALIRRFTKGVFVLRIVLDGTILFVSVLCLNLLFSLVNQTDQHQDRPAII